MFQNKAFFFFSFAEVILQNDALVSQKWIFLFSTINRKVNVEKLQICLLRSTVWVISSCLRAIKLPQTRFPFVALWQLSVNSLSAFPEQDNPSLLKFFHLFCWSPIFFLYPVLISVLKSASSFIIFFNSNNDGWSKLGTWR